MSGNRSKWERKRSIDDDDESEDTTAAEVGEERSSRDDDLRADTLDEMLQEKRRRLDDREESALGGSKQNSRGSSPASVPSRRSSSRHDSPAEVIYQLSPEQHTLSPISSGSRTPSKSKSPYKDEEKKGKREKKYSAEEEEGEILSDVSDSERKQKLEIGGPQETSGIQKEQREKGTSSAKSSEEESEDESSEEESSEGEEVADEAEKEGQSKKEIDENDSESESESEDEESSDEDEEMEAKEDVKEIPKVGSKDSESSEESEDDESESEIESEKEEPSSKNDNRKETKGKETVVVVEDEAEDFHKELKKLKEKKTLDEKEKSYRSREDEYYRDSSWRKDSRYKGSGKDKSHRERSRYEEEKTTSQERSYSRDAREKSYRDERERRPVVKEKSDDSKLSREKSHRSSSSKSRTERSNYPEKERASSSRPSSDPDKRSARRDYSKYKSSKEPSKKESKPSSKRERSEKTVLAKEPREKVPEETKAPEEVEKFSVLTEKERRQFNREVVDLTSEESSVEDESGRAPISDVDMKSDSEDEQKKEEEEEEEEEDEGEKLPPYLPAVQGCRNVEEFQWLNRIEEGSYGVVYRAKDKRTGEVVALKKLKMEREKGGFPITSLREINTLLKAQHENIVTVREIVVGSNMDKIYIVMDYVEHDLKTLMEHMTNQFTIGEVKTLLFQLLEAVKHLHDRWILHRDLKTSNLLLSNQGILKVGDFGLAREYGSPLKNYTPIVVTLWYRAPELLLGTKEYSTPIDLWSVGCIFAELLTMKPLFTGKSEIDQINKIFQELGTPSDKIWPGPPAYSELPHVKKMTFAEYPYNNLRNKFGTYLSDGGFDLLNRFLTYDPKKRITAEEASQHQYFKEYPLPVDPSFFPTWPARSELMKRPKRSKDYDHSPSAPEGGAVFAKLAEEGDGSGSGAAGFRMPPSKKGSAAVAGFTLKF